MSLNVATLVLERDQKRPASLSHMQADAGDGSVCQPKGHCKVLKKFIIAGVVAATATLGVAGIAYADTGTSSHRTAPAASTSGSSTASDSDSDADSDDASSSDDSDADDSSSDDDGDDNSGDTNDSNDSGSDSGSGGLLGGI
jgi:hypothetical protein